MGPTVDRAQSAVNVDRYLISQTERQDAASRGKRPSGSYTGALNLSDISGNSTKQVWV